MIQVEFNLPKFQWDNSYMVCHAGQRFSIQFQGDFSLDCCLVFKVNIYLFEYIQYIHIQYNVVQYIDLS